MRWILPAAFVSTALAFLTSQLSPCAAQSAKPVAIGRDATLDIPESAQLERSPNLPHHLVYSVVMGDRTMLGIYRGTTPQGPPDGPSQDVVIGGCLVTSYAREANGKRSRDLYLGTSEGYAFFHIYYFDLTSDEAALSDTMVGSLRLTDPTMCKRV